MMVIHLKVVSQLVRCSSKVYINMESLCVRSGTNYSSYQFKSSNYKAAWQFSKEQ
mgnify:CR=1 FL=1